MFDRIVAVVPAPLRISPNAGLTAAIRFRRHEASITPRLRYWRTVRAAEYSFDRTMRVCPRCHSIYTADPGFCGVDGAELIEQEDDPLIGRSVDRYLIRERVGSGGMGCVYRAR